MYDFHPAILRSAVMAGALLAQQAAGATAPGDPAAGSVPQITVVAPRPPEPHEIAGDNVATFIRTHGKPGKRIGQLGRWVEPACPAVRGLAQGFNDFVAARLQAIAAAVHVPPQASPHCETNILIIFTTEPQAFLDDVAKRHPNWLGFHFEAEIPKLKTMNRPIQAWYSTATHNRSLELHFTAPLAGAQSDTALDHPSASTPGATLGSRLSTGMESFIAFTLVVVDTQKIIDHTIGSIADYISMSALSQTQFSEDCGGLPSILDLMTPKCQGAAPDAITAGDIAYLKALYTIDLAHDAAMQRSSIEDLMMRSFTHHD